MAELKTKNGNFLGEIADIGLNTTKVISDMKTGGQLGLGRNAATLDAATPLVFPPANVFVIQTPTMYDSNAGEGGSKARPEMAKMIKALLESHAKSWTGIDVEYTMDVADSPAGHDGQNLQTPTTHKRTQPSPNATFDEVTGNLVWALHHQWQCDIQDPDTNGAMMGMGDQVKPYVMSTYSCTLMVVQFDATSRPDKIIDASVIVNVFPTSIGPLGMQRQIGTTEIKERSIQYTGLLLHNKKIRDAAIAMVEKMELHKVMYENDVRGFDPEMEGTLATDVGLKTEIKNAVAAFREVEGTSQEALSQNV